MVLSAITRTIHQTTRPASGITGVGAYSVNISVQNQHNNTGEDNGDGHLKRTIMGREVVVAVTAGQLDFGPWEQIFYGEFDGRRRKRVLVKIIGE